MANLQASDLPKCLVQKVGEAVFANVFDLGTGSIAEYVAVPEAVAAPKPANLDFVQAA